MVDGGQEIENLIPIDIRNAVCKDIFSSKTGIGFLEFLLKKDTSDCSPVYYFDYKKGIAREKFFIKDNPDREDEKKFHRLEEYRYIGGRLLKIME